MQYISTFADIWEILFFTDMLSWWAVTYCINNENDPDVSKYVTEPDDVYEHSCFYGFDDLRSRIYLEYLEYGI